MKMRKWFVRLAKSEAYRKILPFAMGFTAAFSAEMTMQDWMGKDRYLEWAERTWVPWSPLGGIACLVVSVAMYVLWFRKEKLHDGRRDLIRADVCPICGKPENHFVPPSFDETGFFICAPKHGDRA